VEGRLGEGSTEDGLDLGADMPHDLDITLDSVATATTLDTEAAADAADSGAMDPQPRMVDAGVSGPGPRAGHSCTPSPAGS
jgi:hypothetical protein